MKFFGIFLALNLVDFCNGTFSESPLLFEAILEGNMTLTQKLLECSWADANAKTAFGLTGLMQASNLGKNSIVETLLNHGASINAQSLKTGWTPLMYASASGWVETVRLLLKRGAEPDVQDAVGNTALTVSVNGAIKELLANRTQTSGKSALWYSKSSNSKALLVATKSRALSTTFKTAIPAFKTNPIYPLSAVVARGYLSLVRPLLDAGADVNFQDRKGVTSLMLAAYYGYGDILKTLLNADAEVNYPNLNGWTALHFAAQRQHTKICNTLLNYGADVNAKSTLGVTPLMLAALSSFETVKLLVSKNANVTLTDVNGASALHFAAEGRQLETLKLLSDSGAFLDQPKLRDGGTPLMFSVQRGDAATSRRLLELGANVNAKTRDGSTSLMFAAFRNDFEVVKLLLEFGADPTPRTLTGSFDALDFTTDEEIMKILLSKLVEFENSSSSSAPITTTNAFTFLVAVLLYFEK